MAAILVLAATLFLAYANGANDTFKGVATLYGSGTAGYRRALGWATVTTLAGALAAIWVSAGLVQQFGGTGLVPDEVATSGTFPLSIAIGSALTVLLATRLGMPISTTHALTGSLVGAGLVAGGSVAFSRLFAAFVLPLVAGPALAFVATRVLAPALREAGRRLRIREETCLCVGALPAPVPVPARCDLALVPGTRFVLLAEHAARIPQLSVAVGTEATCVRRYHGALWGVSVQQAVDALHLLSAGAVGCARGLNDAPKIVALLVGAGVFGLEAGMAAVAVAMALGGWVHSRRIAETMGKKITAMNAGEACTANLTTAVLVGLGAWHSLPLSTTHVSCGSLFGIGAASGEARWEMIRQILLAWVITLPLAAALAAAIQALAG